MIIDEILSEVRKLKTVPKELKKFGITMAVVLSLLSGLAIFKGSRAFPYLLALAAGFLILGLIRPSLLKQIYIGWMTLAITLGYFMTRVILTILFFGVFMIIGVIARFVNRDMLDQQFDSTAATYWKRHEEPQEPKQRLEKQF